MYKCICGMVFDNPQKFNGHKQACKEHIINKYGSLDAYYSIKNRGHQRSVETKKRNKAQKWIDEKHVCESCGKIMERKYGSGRFCCSFCAHKRKQKQATKEKIKGSVLLRLGVEQRLCSECGCKIERRNKSGFCRSCFLKHVTISESTREKLRKSHIGKTRWNIRRNQISYAEKFFIRVLENNNIQYEHEYQVLQEDKIHSYYLDFLLPGGFDLEIDGKQHDDRKDLDEKRDIYLSSIGFIVYRIPWNDISSKNGKLKMKEKIDKFLSDYKCILEGHKISGEK